MWDLMTLYWSNLSFKYGLKESVGRYLDVRYLYICKEEGNRDCLSMCIHLDIEWKGGDTWWFEAVGQGLLNKKQKHQHIFIQHSIVLVYLFPLTYYPIVKDMSTNID